MAERTAMLVANTSWYLWNFRRRLAEALLGQGFELVFAAPQDQYSERLSGLGRFVPVEFDRKGKNPLREMATVYALRQLLRIERPGVVLTWTPKPNIYCGLAARGSRTRLVPNVSGLGTAFASGELLPALVKSLYSLAFHSLPVVFFQNAEDRETLAGAGCIQKSAARLLPGSGVDLERFKASPLPANDTFRFLYGGRLLKEKGLPELVEAMRAIRADGIAAELVVYGHFDPGNPLAISEPDMRLWEDEGLLRYRGQSDHMQDAIREADCVVHPSWYREGLPRILLEAAASARPVVTTDNVGCRDALDPGVTGYLCESRDVASLTEALRAMIDLAPETRDAMGRAGRRLAESKFDERIVIDEYLDVIAASG